ncbi:MAG TPA: SDR family oxidoreductase [Steroidobacteraceae bacterium]|jgi:3-oxoacyl-[acyl-carrier protein] reductase
MNRIADLQGRRVLITGASSGIGAALARAFAQQRARVVLHFNGGASQAREIADAIRADSGSVVTLQGDLALRDAARRVIEQSVQALSGLDVLINNAGSLVERRPILESDDALVDSIFDLNARSVVAACLAAVPHLERQQGAIINVGSIAGIDGGGSGSGIYASAKAFVHTLTRHLARELAPRHIRVNAVSPGVIETPFHAATPPERLEALRRAIPMGRLGAAQDCVGAFLFLASNELSGYITGQNIHVNGGQLMQ